MSGPDRKAAIVRAALPLFAQKGFARTTTRDLAKAAGVSEPLLYRHFPSKDALYLAIQNSSCRGFDPDVKRLKALPASTASLVELTRYMMRAFLLGITAGDVQWETRHRLMLNSLLGDGAYARLLYRTRLDWFCSQMEQCLAVGIRKGEVRRGPVDIRNRVRLAHHTGAWLAVMHLPPKPAMTYSGSGKALLDQAVWFVLRGMGVQDKAIASNYKQNLKS
jgi:AcrR family transcriptional regulator